MSAKTITLGGLVLLAVFFGVMGMLVASAWYWGLAVLAPFYLVAAYDLSQRQHTLLRNYPVLGHGRYLISDFRHQFRQYLIESDREGEPFTHEQRALVYRRAKAVNDVLPFGTIQDVYAPHYQWINHSMQPCEPLEAEPRVRIGGQDCTRPYEASHLNISAMSFGALSSHAILALNAGAKKGGFYHNTGEGGISCHHRRPGGDLVWEIGTGYFGCRNEDGNFDSEKFRQEACTDQVKMIEVKLSQGAKPGGGGILPAGKLTREIAQARGVPMGADVISPAAHRTFSTPIGLLEFIGRLRELADGRPVGFKFCLGRMVDFMAVVKAMLESGLKPDFITIDGGEGGTGAASLELSNHVGTPLHGALVFVHNTLVGAGIRQDLRLITSGKVISAYDLAKNLALGADLCNSARAMMFALGCIQARKCETNRCPTGVATQDPVRVSGLSVPDKIDRVYNYHFNTIRHLLEILAVTGLSNPSDLRPELFQHRLDQRRLINLQEFYPWIEPGALLRDNDIPAWYREPWLRARPDRFNSPLR